MKALAATRTKAPNSLQQKEDSEGLSEAERDLKNLKEQLNDDSCWSSDPQVHYFGPGTRERSAPKKVPPLGVSCFLRPNEARPLTAAKHKRFQNAIGKTLVAVKTAGPSPRGKGHRLTPTDQSVGEIMHSGPSPGANH
nr:hypothetical protein TEA_006911 [Ipomoea trifida]